MNLEENYKIHIIMVILGNKIQYDQSVTIQAEQLYSFILYKIF